MEITLALVTLVSLALASAMSFMTWRVLSLERRREAARVAALVELAREDREDQDDPAAPTGIATLFAEPARESPAGRRFIVMAAFAALIATGLGALFAFGGGSRADGATRAPQPIELLSLRHAREGDRLTITGLVRNPQGSAPLSRVSAVAFVLDPQGASVASGRARLDFTTLAPGDESPFVITVAAPGRLGRYRVGFRSEKGGVVAHVDRRQP